MRVIIHYLFFIFLSFMLFGCSKTQLVEIDNVSEIQKLIIENPIDSGVEIPVTITIDGEVDRKAYMYVEEASSKIQPPTSNPGFTMNIHKGKNHQVFHRQVSPGRPVKLVYVPINTKEGNLRIEVKF